MGKYGKKKGSGRKRKGGRRKEKKGGREEVELVPKGLVNIGNTW